MKTKRVRFYNNSRSQKTPQVPAPVTGRGNVTPGTAKLGVNIYDKMILLLSIKLEILQPTYLRASYG